MHSPGIARLAAAVLALEGMALTAIALIELFGLGAGAAGSVPTGIALIALTLIGAGALFAFAAGVLRGRSWARSGGVVVQVIAIALALVSLTVQPVPWGFILGVGLPGLAGLVLLLASAGREAPERPSPQGGKDDQAGE